MKLLGWMHRKFKQNSADPLRDFAIVGHACNCLTGQASLDDQQNYAKPNYGSNRQLFKATQKEQVRKSFAGMESARVEEEEEYDEEEESGAMSSELFHGFLAIGTLGSVNGNTDPSTPTFAISLENITEKETEVTENELKLINDELEKVLGGDQDCCNDSSGRNSYVSAGRSSHGSTITLSGKPIEGQETNGTMQVCPLQGYLFGSAIELSDTSTTTTTTTTTSMVKKENRTSLAELFQRTKVAEENPVVKSDKEEKRAEKESAVHLMKKILKKKMLHASSRNSAAVPGDSASAETKLHKILQIFHRKVHPESSSEKPEKNEKKKNGGEEEDIIMIPETQRNLSKRNMRRYKSQSNPPPQHLMFPGGDSNGSRECWIKTDADYLVLEL